jgi:hypothetical protein
MERWKRWQDWVALAAGALMILTPLWSSPGGAGTAAMLVLGLVLAATALWSLYAPGAVASEYLHAILGVLMFVSPWVFGYVATTTAAWTSWIVGVVAVVVGLMAVPESTRAHQQMAH